MTFKKGDVVRYVGEDLSRQRSLAIEFGGWGPLAVAMGATGIVESVMFDEGDNGSFYRCGVRLEIPYVENFPLGVLHIEQTMYDFELEKI